MQRSASNEDALILFKFWMGNLSLGHSRRTNLCNQICTIAEAGLEGPSSQRIVSKPQQMNDHGGKMQMAEWQPRVSISPSKSEACDVPVESTQQFKQQITHSHTVEAIPNTSKSGRNELSCQEIITHTI